MPKIESQSPVCNRTNEKSPSLTAEGNFLGRAVTWVMNEITDLIAKIINFFRNFFSISEVAKSENLESIKNKIENPETKITTLELQATKIKAITPSLITSTPINEGLCVNELDMNEKMSIARMINSWLNRKDKEKLTWTKDELAKVFDIHPEPKKGVDELCYRLQILQENIPAVIIDYYLGSFQYYLKHKSDHTFSPNLNIKDRFKGEASLHAYGDLRFPGIKIKEQWSINELSMYLSVTPSSLEETLRENNMQKHSGSYSSEEITDQFLDSLRFNPKVDWTQRNSIRFSRCGLYTAPDKVSSTEDLQ